MSSLAGWEDEAEIIFREGSGFTLSKYDIAEFKNWLSKKIAAEHDPTWKSLLIAEKKNLSDIRNWKQDGDRRWFTVFDCWKELIKICGSEAAAIEYMEGTVDAP